MHVTMTSALPRLPSSVTRARQVLTILLSLTDAGPEVCDYLALLISEACANAVRHADEGTTIAITIKIDEHVCVIEVGNRGTSPDDAGLRTALPGPLTVGGRGLPLIAALADTATFLVPKPGEVTLRMTKQLIPVPHP